MSIRGTLITQSMRFLLGLLPLPFSFLCSLLWPFLRGFSDPPRRLLRRLVAGTVDKIESQLSFNGKLPHPSPKGATLFLKDLQRNGVDMEEEIYRITYYGKGRMAGFGENCTPRGQCTFGARLQEEEIKLLAEFVKSQADEGWTNIESYAD